MTEAAEGSALRRRSRTSFDFRLFAIFFLSWIAVGVTPKTWRIENVLGGMLLVLVFFVGLSIHHRRQLGWRWPGVRVTNGVLQIIFLLWLGALFAWMFVSLSGQVVREMTPFLGCLGTILLYAVLSTLNLVVARESEFLRYCHRDYLSEGASLEVRSESTPTPTVPQRPRGHTAVHWFMLFYWLVLVSAGAGHWAYLNRLARREQTEAAPERTEVIKEGRQTIHVTPSEKERLTILKDIYMWGWLSWLVLYLVARFLLGVKPHSVMSTLPEPEVQPTRNRSP